MGPAEVIPLWLSGTEGMSYTTVVYLDHWFLHRATEEKPLGGECTGDHMMGLGPEAAD